MRGDGRWEREEKEKRESDFRASTLLISVWVTEKRDSPPCPSRRPHQTFLNSPRAFIQAPVPRGGGRGDGENEAGTSSSSEEGAVDKGFSAWICTNPIQELVPTHSGCCPGEFNQRESLLCWA